MKLFEMQNTDILITEYDNEFRFVKDEINHGTKWRIFKNWLGKTHSYFQNHPLEKVVGKPNHYKLVNPII